VIKEGTTQTWVIVFNNQMLLMYSVAENIWLIILEPVTTKWILNWTKKGEQCRHAMFALSNWVYRWVVHFLMYLLQFPSNVIDMSRIDLSSFTISSGTPDWLPPIRSRRVLTFLCWTLWIIYISLLQLWVWRDLKCELQVGWILNSYPVSIFVHIF